MGRSPRLIAAAFSRYTREFASFLRLRGAHLSDTFPSDMRTTLRNFQRQFAAMRAQADAGETVMIEADGAPRYIFKLSQPAAREPLSRLLARTTSELEPRRDKRPMRRA